MVKFKKVNKEFRKNKEKIRLPERATKGSAGYDFFLPHDVMISPGESKLIYTDVKAQMEPDMVLQIFMRSSYGIKKNLMLKNITGIIDYDFFENESNDGNIIACIYNYGDTPQYLKQGDAFCQGIFVRYALCDGDKTVKERKGGVGSTDEKEVEKKKLF